MKKDYISINEMTRPGNKIKEVRGIILHEIGNRYSNINICKKQIENLCNQDVVYYSLHYIIDKYGNILSLIPEDEISLSCRNIDENYYNLSIGCIPHNEVGEFSNETITSLIKLISNLCNRYGLNEKRIFRHYDITGKRCPKYYIDNNIKFEKIKKMIKIDIQ